MVIVNRPMDYKPLCVQEYQVCSVNNKGNAVPFGTYMCFNVPVPVDVHLRICSMFHCVHIRVSMCVCVCVCVYVFDPGPQERLG